MTNIYLAFVEINFLRYRKCRTFKAKRFNVNYIQRFLSIVYAFQTFKTSCACESEVFGRGRAERHV